MFTAFDICQFLDINFSEDMCLISLPPVVKQILENVTSNEVIQIW